MAQSAALLRVLQRRDQVGERRVVDAAPALGCGDGETDGEVGLPDARGPEEDHILSPLDEAQRKETLQLVALDARLEAEVEVGQGLHGREPGRPGRDQGRGSVGWFPFGQAFDLKKLLEVRWVNRRGLFVFYHSGKPLRSLRRCWATACREAGAAGRLVHDLRRTFARNRRRAGVSEGDVMRLAGWRTRSMFDRYNIIDEADLEAAVARRYGTLRATSEPPAASPPSLSSSAATRPL